MSRSVCSYSKHLEKSNPLGALGAQPSTRKKIPGQQSRGFKSKSNIADAVCNIAYSLSFRLPVGACDAISRMSTKTALSSSTSNSVLPHRRWRTSLKSLQLRRLSSAVLPLPCHESARPNSHCSRIIAGKLSSFQALELGCFLPSVYRMGAVGRVAVGERCPVHDCKPQCSREQGVVR